MRARRITAAVLLSLACWRGAAAVETAFPLPAVALEVVTDEAKFRTFAEKVGAEVERLLATPAAVDDRATLNLLLSTRVHLAHYFGDGEKAIATAAWIRSRQDDPALRAFAGLTTVASVETRRKHPGLTPENANARATFLNEFMNQLAGLPRTREIAIMLRGQREKVAGLGREPLLAEVRTIIQPAIARRGYCGLAEADQLVRVHHRLQSILPVQDETLQALDAAIAARASP